MLLFKALGLVTLFFACSAQGFLKAQSLKKRAEKLALAEKGLSQTAEFIRGEGCEKERLVSRCFTEEMVIIGSQGVVVNGAFFEGEDILLMEEFFSGFGMGDVEGEYNRTRLYTQLIKKQKEQAQENAQRLCRLYRSLGVLSGIFLCIFLV